MRRHGIHCAWALILAVALAGCPSKQSNQTQPPPAPAAKNEEPAAKPDPAPPAKEAPPKEQSKEQAKEEAKGEAAAGAAKKDEAATKGADTGNPKVLLVTSMGNIKLELNRARAPKTVKNFMAYVKSGHYKGTIFHRVISTFMIQGGGFDKEMNEKQTNSSIQNEADNGLKNERGTVAMARTPNPHSASSQFFINVKNNGMLNHRSKDVRGWGYCVFGKVIEGMEVVDKIKAVATGNHGHHGDVPKTPITITDAKEL